MRFSTIIIALAAVSVVILLANRWRRSSEGKTRDGEVLAQLREAGSDLSKPHPVEFFLYFPSEEAARHVGVAIADQGFTIEVRQAAQGSNWAVLAGKIMVPNEADLLRIREAFDALATAQGGEYDGWGTPVVP